jgi:hypothetical protein
MRSYLTVVTVEEEVGANVVSHEIPFIFHPILRRCDCLGIYHQGILFESDLKLLSKLHISIKDRDS